MVDGNNVMQLVEDSNHTRLSREVSDRTHQLRYVYENIYIYMYTHFDLSKNNKILLCMRKANERRRAPRTKLGGVAAIGEIA